MRMWQLLHCELRLSRDHCKAGIFSSTFLSTFSLFSCLLISRLAWMSHLPLLHTDFSLTSGHLRLCHTLSSVTNLFNSAPPCSFPSQRQQLFAGRLIQGGGCQSVVQGPPGVLEEGRSKQEGRPDWTFSISSTFSSGAHWWRPRREFEIDWTQPCVKKGNYDLLLV